MGHPAVQEAAVIAVHSAKWMERPMAAVVLRKVSVAIHNMQSILPVHAQSYAHRCPCKVHAHCLNYSTPKSAQTLLHLLYQKVTCFIIFAFNN